MTEFAARSLELFNQLKANDGDKANIEKDLRALAEHIKKKSGEDVVPQLAQQLKNRLIEVYKIVTTPNTLPSYKSAKTLYLENCAQCHGDSGKGDGPGRESMHPKEPPPANFTDPERIGGLSHFKVFNTASLCIEGTAMASFGALSEEQRWQVAFYIFSLRFSAGTTAAGETWLKGKPLPRNLVSVEGLATSSEEELSRTVKKNFPDAPVNEVLAYLRRGLLEKKSADPLLIARNRLSEAADLYSKDEREKAYQKAMEAYLDGFEIAEPALFAALSKLN